MGNATRARRLADHAHLAAWQSRRIVACGRLLLAGIVLVQIACLARVVQLKVAPDPRLEAVTGSAVSSRLEPARRGDLLDRRGRLIASTTTGYRLFIDPGLVEDVQTIALDVAALIGCDPVEIDRRLQTRPDARYVVVDDLLESWQVDAVRSSPLAGLGLELRPVRLYPSGDLGAGMVGCVGFEHTGLSGMEHRFEDRMHPEAGRLTYLRDARRRPLWIDPAGYEPAADGGPVRLSVDLVIQQLAEERLRAAVLEFNAGGGRVVVMDCETGELLAMHDLVNPRAGWDEQIGDPLRLRDPALGRNRCVTDPYEPGSTFKPFIWSTVTHLGRASMDEVLPTPAAGVHRTPYGRRITDAHAMADATWREVLIHSMNSGMAIAAERLSHREMQHAVAAFCFGERTGSGLPGESAGIVTTAAEWSAYTQTSVAMGYEIAVTPLQMVRAFSAFARDGTIPTPRFTAVTGAEREYRFLRRATPESVAITTRGVMREVMTQGTGRRVSSRRYTIFGKSGTAHLARRNEPGYHEDRYVSSFIAGAPFHEPRIVVLCVIDDPDRSLGHFGGTVAGPVVRDVIDGALEYLGVPPDRDGAM